MATYTHKTRDEKAVTVNGSYHDRRLAMSKGWDRVDDAGTHEAEPEPPARNAPTDEWQTYATQVHQVPEDQAKKMSRADLIARAETGPAAKSDPPALPAKSDPKDDWVEAAIAQGMASYDAANMSKSDLISHLEGA